MARKLTSDEEHAFASALQQGGGALPEAVTDWCMQTLSKSHPATVSLAPELGEWIGEDLPTGFGF